MRQATALFTSILLTAGCATATVTAQPSPSPSGAHPREAACMPYREAEAEAARIQSDNARSRDAARAQAGVTAIRLPSERLEGSAPSVPFHPQARFRPAWQVFTDNRGRRILAGEVVQYECHWDIPGPPTFVQGADGDIYVEVDEPQYTGHARIRICACQPWPITCGAYMPGTVQMLYALPTGTEYKGRLTIRYPARRIQRSYHPPAPCPPPQMPPSVPPR